MKWLNFHMIDTTRTIDIERSGKTVALTLVGVLLTAGASALAFGSAPEDALFVRLLGLTGLILFALHAGRSSGTVQPKRPCHHAVSAGHSRSADCRRDHPLARGHERFDLEVSVFTERVGLSVDAAVEARLTFSPIVRCTRPINRAFGDEIRSASGAKTNFETLMADITAYWQAWRGQQTHRHRQFPY